MCETVTISQITPSSGNDSRCPSGGQQSPKTAPDTPAAIRRITESDLQARNKKLCEIVGKPEVLTSEQTEQLHQFLGEHHALSVWILMSKEKQTYSSWRVRQERPHQRNKQFNGCRLLSDKK